MKKTKAVLVAIMAIAGCVDVDDVGTEPAEICKGGDTCLADLYLPGGGVCAWNGPTNSFSLTYGNNSSGSAPYVRNKIRYPGNQNSYFGQALGAWATATYSVSPVMGTTGGVGNPFTVRIDLDDQFALTEANEGNNIYTSVYCH